MKPKFLDEPYPRNPWTPHTQANPFDGHALWNEFKYSMTHPRDEFKRMIFGLYGKNPDLHPEWRFVAFAFLFVGVLQLILGIIAISMGLLI